MEHGTIVKVNGHRGSWSVIACEVIRGRKLNLLEHTFYGDEAANLIVNEKGALVMEDVYNGFDDYREMKGWL